MPFEEEGGAPSLISPYSTTIVRIVTPETTVGGYTATGEPLVSEQSRTIAQATEEATKATKIIPVATAPAVANLPHNAKAGEHYTFASQPNYEYVYGPDNLWRAIVLVAVV